MEDHFDISGAFEISKFEITGCTCNGTMSALGHSKSTGADNFLITPCTLRTFLDVCLHIT